MSYRKEEDYDNPKARCLECGELCDVKRVDYGVGRIEVHGVVTNHHDWQWECPECGGQVEEI